MAFWRGLQPAKLVLPDLFLKFTPSCWFSSRKNALSQALSSPALGFVIKCWSPCKQLLYFLPGKPLCPLTETFSHNFFGQKPLSSWNKSLTLSLSKPLDCIKRHRMHQQILIPPQDKKRPLKHFSLMSLLGVIFQSPSCLSKTENQSWYSTLWVSKMALRIDWDCNYCVSLNWERVCRNKLNEGEKIPGPIINAGLKKMQNLNGGMVFYRILAEGVCL